MLRRRTLFGLGLAGLGGWLRLTRAVAASEPALAPDIARIRERGRLVVAVAGFAIPPFVTIGRDGAPTGADIDIATDMAKTLGVGLAFDHRARSGDEMIDIIAARAADLAISKLSVTLDRALRVRFSRPYLVLHQALLFNRLRFAQTAKGRDPIEVVQEGDASIGVMAGGAYVEYAKRLLPHARLREYADWPSMIDAVRRGDVVAAYGDELEVRHALMADPAAPLQLRPAILADTRDPIGIALPWDSPSLLAWVDLYLETAAKPLDVDELLTRYGTHGDVPSEGHPRQDRL
jgi:polar amino acid transport system substrate-binding protein